MTSATTPGAGVRPDRPLRYRPVREEELPACAEIWRDSINDYILPLGQAEIPADTGSLQRLYGHLQRTDPERFVAAVAEGADAGADRIVGFAAAVRRERLWFLSMCFVRPEAQGGGIGRRLVAEAGPAPDDGRATIRATATDSAQPISNALYASLGMVPRMPLLDFIGHPVRPEAFGSLPSGIRPIPFEQIAGRSAADDGHARLASAVDELDRELLGVAHPVDHRYLRVEGRRGWLYHGPDGSPVAYGYATEAGRVGPVAARDPRLIAPILGHLTAAVTPRGAFAIWIPGAADEAIVATLGAGLRLDPFPILLCWDRPFADLARYLPISPGLL